MERTAFWMQTAAVLVGVYGQSVALRRLVKSLHLAHVDRSFVGLAAHETDEDAAS